MPLTDAFVKPLRTVGLMYPYSVGYGLHTVLSRQGVPYTVQPTVLTLSSLDRVYHT